MVSKIYKSTPFHFFMVLDTSFIAEWQYNLLLEITENKLGSCLGVINLNIINKEPANKYSQKIVSKYIKNKSSDFNNRIESLRNLNLKVIDLDIDTDSLKDIVCNIDSDVNLILNFTDYDLYFKELNCEYGIWNYTFSGYETRGLPRFFENSYLTGSPVVSSSITAKLENNLPTCILKEHVYSANFLTHIELSEFTKDMIKSTIKLMASYPNINLNDLRNSTSLENSDQSLNIFNYLKFKYKHFCAYLRKLIQSEFLLETWSIGLKIKDTNEVLNSKYIKNTVWLDLSKEYYFVADPFLIEKEDKLFVLAEAIGKDSDKGLIVSYLVDKKTLQLGKPELIFKEKTHFSYPYVFENEGNLYLLPESTDTNEVNLYKSKELPNEWTKIATLINNRKILDASIIKYDEKWWMFCTELTDGPLSNLKVWHSDHLEYGWTELGLNPVVSDIRFGRPAGRPFVIDGKLYRPAQNSQKSYGGGLEILEILALNQNEFRERPVNTIIPNPKSGFVDGIHTLSLSENYMIIDGKKISFNFGMFFNYLLRKLKIK